MTPFHEAEHRFKAGIEAKHHNDLPTALGHFQAAVDLNPHYTEAYSEAGAIAYALGDFEGAVLQLRQAIHLDPHQGNPYLFLALTLGELKQHDEAEAQFQKAIGISDTPSVAQAVYANYLGAQKRPEAEQAFKDVLELDPDCVMAWRDYARLLASQDRDDEAETMFRKALEIQPDSPATHLQYGRFLSFFDHRLREGVSHLYRALELDPGLQEAQELLDVLAEEQGLAGGP